MTPCHVVKAALLSLTLTAMAAGAAAAQAGDAIILTEPDAWSRGRSMSLTEGDTVRVRGVATHAAGVTRVLINGVEAELRRDPAFPNLVDFTGIAIAAADATHVLITLVPASGAQVEQRFGVEVARAAQTPPRAVPPARPESQAAQPLPMANPWRPFRMRGIGYGALAAGGAVLASMTTTETSERCEQVGHGQECYLRVEERPAYKSAGLGLIGVAVAGAIVDGIMTSRRASAVRSAAPAGREEDDGSAGRGLRLDAPDLAHRDGRLSLAVVRLRF